MPIKMNDLSPSFFLNVCVLFHKKFIKKTPAYPLGKLKQQRQIIFFWERGFKSLLLKKRITVALLKTTRTDRVRFELNKFVIIICWEFTQIPYNVIVRDKLIFIQHPLRST
ncbi:hypothetical protein B1NLA3E_20400 [Bacillus sp. 1NLA3E]|nr:hypothetical protein B1NLA3E_20400 [Bacillus sp. 1NLA3E]